MGIQRKQGLKRGKPMKRSRMKTKVSKKDWRLARKKVDEEGRCRYYGGTEGLEAAHVIGQARADRPDDTGVIVVNPDDICPLCKNDHLAYDARRLDILAVLYPHEQARAVLVAGGIVAALRRITGSRD